MVMTIIQSNGLAEILTDSILYPMQPRSKGSALTPLHSLGRKFIQHMPKSVALNYGILVHC